MVLLIVLNEPLRESPAVRAEQRHQVLICRMVTITKHALVVSFL